MKHLFSITSFFLLFTFACKKEDCTIYLPPPNFFTLTITDESGNNILETKDSIRMYNDVTDRYIPCLSFGEVSGFQIFYSYIESGKNIYFELDDTDTDTLNIVFSVNEGECFNSYEALRITYNRNAVSDLKSPFELKK